VTPRWRIGRVKSCSLDHDTQSGSGAGRSDAVTSCVREGCIDAWTSVVRHVALHGKAMESANREGHGNLTGSSILGGGLRKPQGWDWQPGRPPARGTRALRKASFDARNRGSTRLPLKRKYGIGRTRAVGAPLTCPRRRRQKSNGCSGGKTPDHFFPQLSFANHCKYFSFSALSVDFLKQNRYFSVVRRRIFLS